MSAQSKRTPGPMVADYNTAELPFRICSKAKQGNIGYAYTEADADLFAAAPDMLYALKAIAENDPYRTSAAGDIARAAIAKAEGL